MRIIRLLPHSSTKDRSEKANHPPPNCTLYSFMFHITPMSLTTSRCHLYYCCQNVEVQKVKLVAESKSNLSETQYRFAGSLHRRSKWKLYTVWVRSMQD